MYPSDETPKERRRRRKLPIIVVGILLAMTFMGFAAAVVILTHTFPAVTPDVVLTSTCTTLTPNPTHVAVGSAGTVLFNCGGTTPGLTVATAGSTTPAYTLPVGYVNFYRYDASVAPGAGLTCIIREPGAVALTSGVSNTFAATPVNWNYCADFLVAPLGGFATFTLTWNMP
jgi:hypothetical protein